jgi:hypothetical protein
MGVILSTALRAVFFDIQFFIDKAVLRLACPLFFSLLPVATFDVASGQQHLGLQEGGGSRRYQKRQQ